MKMLASGANAAGGRLCEREAEIQDKIPKDVCVCEFQNKTTQCNGAHATVNLKSL